MISSFPVVCGVIATTALLAAAFAVAWRGKPSGQRNAVPALLAVSSFVVCYTKVFLLHITKAEVLPTFLEFANTAAIAFITVRLATDKKSSAAAEEIATHKAQPLTRSRPPRKR